MQKSPHQLSRGARLPFGRGPELIGAQLRDLLFRQRGRRVPPEHAVPYSARSRKGSPGGLAGHLPLPPPGTPLAAGTCPSEVRLAGVDVRRAAVGIKTASRSLRRQAPRPDSRFVTLEHLTIQRMEHVGIVVDDLAAATEFFVELGLELQGEAAVEGRVVDRVVGLEGVRTEVSFMQTPDGHGRLELIKFHTPSDQGDNPHAQANTPVSAISHSPSRTSTPSSPACEPAALSSSASWSATRTATGSATSAGRRGSSSSWRSRSANGSTP